MHPRRNFLSSGLSAFGAGILAENLHAQETGSPGSQSSTKPLVVGAADGLSVWAMGIQVTVKVTAEQTNGAYSVFEDLIPPGSGPPPHLHTREDETIYVLEGSLRAWLDGVRYDVSPGDFVHMPRGVEHYFKNVSDKPTRLLLTYTPGGFEDWFKVVGKPIVGDSLQPPTLTKADLVRAVQEAEKFGVQFRVRKS